MSHRVAPLWKLLTFIVIVMLPGLIIGLLGHLSISTALTFGSFMGMTAGILIGHRFVLWMALPTGVVAGLTVLAADRAWLALLVMGCVAAAVGYSSRWGLNQALIMIPIGLGFILGVPPIVTAASLQDAAIVAGLVAIGLLWTALLTWALGSKLHHPALKPLASKRALIYALNLGLVIGIAAWFVVFLQLQHGGAWLLLTLSLVIQPYIQDAWTKTIQRLGGTLIGFVIADVIGVLLPYANVDYVLGVAFIIVALDILINTKRPYWQFVMFLTPAIILLVGSGGSVTSTALQRVVYTAIGVAVSLLVVVIERPFAKRVAARHHLVKY